MSNIYPLDDPHHAAIYVVIGFIAEGLKSDFSKYASVIFEKVLVSY